MDLLSPPEFCILTSILNPSFTQNGIMASTDAYGRFPGRMILGTTNLPNPSPTTADYQEMRQASYAQWTR